MHILGVGQNADLGDMYLRLQARGHDVRVHIADPDSADVLEGMVVRSASWLDDIGWVRADPGGVVLFEGTGWGQAQDRLREDGVRIIGGSSLGDRLELDRSYGQAVLRDMGLPVAPSYDVLGFDEAIRIVTAHPARYVLKFSGAGFASTRTYVGVLDNGADMLAALRLQKKRWTHAEIPRLLLMKHIDGVEVGTGGYFNGTRFIGPPNLDWEHKRFFPDDLGELTGEMGTVVTYCGADRLFNATLGRVAPLLRDTGYVGYINLNLIVNDQGTFPLEFTCRFGYPGFAILSALQSEPWDTLLDRLVRGDDAPLKTHPGFAVGIVLTVPPFPYVDGYERLSKGAAIVFRDDTTEADRDALHFGEVRMEDGQLVTAGQIGFVMVATGRGASVREARDAAHARAQKVVVPNVRYRTDIGEKLATRDYRILQELGWLP